MFDYKNEYESQIEPLLERLTRFCAVHRIPFFCSVCIKEDGKHTEYRNSINGTVSQGIKLSDDQILKHINVANGFDTILKRESLEHLEIFDELEDEF